MRKSCFTGAYGLTIPAKIAASNRTSKTMAPARPGVERTNRPRAATHGEAAARTVTTDAGPAADPSSSWPVSVMPLVPDARIERRVDDVHDQADRHHEERDRDDRPLDDRVVARGDRRHDV